MAVHEYFPVEFILLQEELSKHPDLVLKMSECTSKYLEDRLAFLCTQLDILVDDDFDSHELADLATMLTKALYKKRTGLIISH